MAGRDDGGTGRRRAGRRRRWLTVALLVVVPIAVGVAVGLWLTRDGGPGAPAAGGSPAAAGATSFPAPAPVATVAPVAPFTAADADRMATALGSPDPAVTALALVPELREDFLASGAQAVPPGSTVTVLTDRFLAVRPDYASVPFVLDGPQRGNYVAVLLYEEGQWSVATTQEVQ